MRNLLFLFTAWLFIAGAVIAAPSSGATASPLDRVFHQETLSQDLQDIVTSGELSKKQCLALQSYISIAQASNVNESVAGRTYRQLFKQAQAFNPKKHESHSDGTPPPFAKPN